MDMLRYTAEAKNRGLTKEQCTDLTMLKLGKTQVPTESAPSTSESEADGYVAPPLPAKRVETGAGSSGLSAAERKKVRFEVKNEEERIERYGEGENELQHGEVKVSVDATSDDDDDRFKKATKRMATVSEEGDDKGKRHKSAESVDRVVEVFDLCQYLRLLLVFVFVFVLVFVYVYIRLISRRAVAVAVAREVAVRFPPSDMNCALLLCDCYVITM